MPTEGMSREEVRLLRKTTELIEKLLALELYVLGASQQRIAKAVGRSTEWVNRFLKGLPKGGRGDGGPAQGKKP